MIVFIHGLNTYGDDSIHVGPLTFGQMHTRLQNEFQKRDIEFIGVTGLGMGSLEEQAERALSFLQNCGVSQDTPITLLGQSTGGLVARVLAARPTFRPSVRALYTVGTPHSGSEAALFGLDFSKQYPFIHQTFRRLGYDAHAKASIFRHYTPDAMGEFNARYPAVVPEFSLICDVSESEISAPLKVFHRHLHKLEANGAMRPSDGFISVASQTRGQIAGRFALDHFAQLGAFYQLTVGARRKARSEFMRMVDAVAVSKS
jgi:pimeloyl-ACP methyl ester carboxylesterase